MFHGCEVDVAGRLAARALNLQPGKAAVEGLVDCRRGVDRLAIGPHPLIPALAEQLSACWISASPFARISADCVASMLAIARALPSSFLRAFLSPPERGVGDASASSGHPGFQTTRTRTAANEGQQPSSSCRPVRCWHVSSKSRCPRFFHTVLGPASRIASAFCISMVRAQRRQETRSTCRWMSPSCCFWIGLPEGLASAVPSFRTDCQYSVGISSAGPGVGVGGTFLPTTAVIFAICLGVGMRQLAGRSVIPD